MFTQLRFTYEQESHPEEFFIPYVWQLVLSRRLVFITKHMLFVRICFNAMFFPMFYIFVLSRLLFETCNKLVKSNTIQVETSSLPISFVVVNVDISNL